MAIRNPAKKVKAGTMKLKAADTNNLKNKCLKSVYPGAIKRTRNNTFKAKKN